MNSKRKEGVGRRADTNKGWRARSCCLKEDGRWMSGEEEMEKPGRRGKKNNKLQIGFKESDFSVCGQGITPYCIDKKGMYVSERRY